MSPQNGEPEASSPQSTLVFFVNGKRASFHFDKCVNGFNACRESHQTSDISILVTRDYPRECWSPLPLSRFQNVFSVTYVYDSIDALPYQRASILSPRFVDTLFCQFHLDAFRHIVSFTKPLED